jgi:putative transcriptional regulator
MRERAQLSQAVFARYLNLTVGYVSQLERGAETTDRRDTGLTQRDQAKGDRSDSLVAAIIRDVE